MKRVLSSIKIEAKKILVQNRKWDVLDHCGTLLRASWGLLEKKATIYCGLGTVELTVLEISLRSWQRIDINYFKETEFTCSAGVPHNKVVASLVYLNDGKHVEKTSDGEAPLLACYDGIEFPSHDKLKISQMLRGKDFANTMYKRARVIRDRYGPNRLKFIFDITLDF